MGELARMSPAMVPARLAIAEGAVARGITPEQWRVLTDAIFPAAKSAESIVLALDYCRARQMDVFRKPVHIVPMWSRELRRYVETVWEGINSIEITAARTGAWAGMDVPQWGDIVPYEFTDAETGETVVVRCPEWCAVTVWRMVQGVRCPFAEPVYWNECYARRGRSAMPNEMWLKRPRGQLAKCAKAASLRAAFPEEAGYAAEEMEGKEVEAGGIPIEHAPAPALAPPSSPPSPPKKLSPAEFWKLPSLALGGAEMTMGQFVPRFLKAVAAAPTRAHLERLCDDNRVMVDGAQIGQDGYRIKDAIDARLDVLVDRVEEEEPEEPASEEASGT